MYTFVSFYVCISFIKTITYIIPDCLHQSSREDEPCSDDDHGEHGTDALFEIRPNKLISKNDGESIPGTSEYAGATTRQPHSPFQDESNNYHHDDDSVASEDIDAISVGENESDSEDMSF